VQKIGPIKVVKKRKSEFEKVKIPNSNQIYEKDLQIFKKSNSRFYKLLKDGEKRFDLTIIRKRKLMQQ